KINRGDPSSWNRGAQPNLPISPEKFPDRPSRPGQGADWASGPAPRAGRRRPLMIATVLIIVAGIFAIGVVAGIVAVVSLGVRREDNGPFLPLEGPDRLTAGARRLTGLFVRHAPYRAGTRHDQRSDRHLLV